MEINNQEIRSETLDWSREYKSFFSWNPSKSLLASIRSYQKHAKSKTLIAINLKRLAVIRHFFWTTITGTDIPINTVIGGGLIMPHPNGIVIHAKAEIGTNCLIFQQVTIGTAGDKGYPKIGMHVDIGAGAKILGGVTIGDYAVIGANAVVVKDVPPGKTAVGIPAKVIN